MIKILAQKYRVKNGIHFPKARKWLWISLLTVSMGMVESAVVIYLRELYYPLGFKFPLNPVSMTTVFTELIRETATITMLVSIGMLAGKNATERFAWFIYSFAVWDISYYLFLYLILGWPLNLSEWDVLFLIPLIWVGPVWSPLLLSALMIVLAGCILFFSDQNQSAGLIFREWSTLVTGALIVIVSFCKDYFTFSLSHHPGIPLTELFFSREAIVYAADYSPQKFDTWVFLLGFAVIVTAIAMYVFRNRNSRLFKNIFFY